MDWTEIIVHTTTAGSEAVSDLLIRQGADGTMTEDRADIPDPTKPNGIWEIIDEKMIERMPEDVLVHAWFAPDKNLLPLREALGAMKLQPGFGSLLLETKGVHDEDWAETWKQFYKPFRAGKSLVVKPTWEHWDAEPGDKIIEIDPGMAFGSGMHETTSMCLEMLEESVREGEVVFDVGTGSGILAIGAALLGAKNVLAIDIDPSAVKVARENVAHSGLENVITVEEGDLLAKQSSVCSLCVANIIADVIMMFAEPLKSHITPGGLFICSGIIKERADEVEAALRNAGYEILEVRRRGEWAAIRSRIG